VSTDHPTDWSTVSEQPDQPTQYLGDRPSPARGGRGRYLAGGLFVALIAGVIGVYAGQQHADSGPAAGTPPELVTPAGAVFQGAAPPLPAVVLPPTGAAAVPDALKPAAPASPRTTAPATREPERTEPSDEQDTRPDDDRADEPRRDQPDTTPDRPTRRPRTEQEKALLYAVCDRFGIGRDRCEQWSNQEEQRRRQQGGQNGQNLQNGQNVRGWPGWLGQAGQGGQAGQPAQQLPWWAQNR
jgi:hypothetical protein